MCKEKACVKEKCREGMIVGKCLSILGEMMEGRERKPRASQSWRVGKFTVYIPLRWAAMTTIRLSIPTTQDDERPLFLASIITR